MCACGDPDCAPYTAWVARTRARLDKIAELEEERDKARAAERAALDQVDELRRHESALEQQAREAGSRYCNRHTTEELACPQCASGRDARDTA